MLLKPPGIKHEVFQASLKTEHDNHVLSPVAQKQTSAEQERFITSLQGLNQNILKLKEDVKERELLPVWRDLKACSTRLQTQSNSSLEDKLDLDFHEHVVQVLTFFTSCLTLVLQNDQAAHPLRTLQPMIEKHIADLKRDKLVI